MNAFFDEDDTKVSQDNELGILMLLYPPSGSSPTPVAKQFWFLRFLDI